MSGLDDVMLLDEAVCLNVDLGPHALVKGYRGELALPVEASTRLFAVRDGLPVAEIGGPPDLSPFVAAVRTLAQALAFVDLFTAPATHFLFDGAVELTIRPPAGPPWPGAVEPATATEWGVELASAREEPERFVVERNLLVRAGPGAELRRVTEEVRRDGAYAVVGSAVLRQVAAGEVVLPAYE